MTVRKGDTVSVLTGKDRGKQGVVERVLPATSQVVVTGLNVRTKHLKPSKTRPQGGIITLNAPLAKAKVQVVCPSCQKRTRIRMVLPEGEAAKYRACVHCGSSLDTAR